MLFLGGSFFRFKRCIVRGGLNIIGLGLKMFVYKSVVSKFLEGGFIFLV